MQGFNSSQLEEIKTLQPTKSFTLEYHVGQEYPKYTFIVIDSAPPQNIPSAVFVVPQGLENEYHYASAEGNADLVSAISAQRVMLVYIDPHYKISDLESIIGELGQAAKQLLPTEFIGNDAPILTAEEGVGNRVLLFEKKSRYNGNVLVEEVTNSDETRTRRLKFDGFRTVIQSEAVVVDDKLDVEKSMEASPYLDAIRSVVGAGGCTLTLGIKKTFSEARIVSVDIDPVVVEAAQKYFFASHEETMAVLTVNGIEYINTLAKKTKDSMLQNAVHAIIIDVDNKPTSDQELTGPPPAFIQQNCLVSMAQSLFTANMKSVTPPVIVFNIVTRNPQLRKESIENLGQYFRQLYMWSGEDLNCIVFGFVHEIQPFDISVDNTSNEKYKSFLSNLKRLK
ncbi:Spermidine synthase [Entamoeba marina]